MAGLEEIDWADLFGLTLPFWEIVIRGTGVYWFMFLVFRFVVPRHTGTVGMADVLLLVMVADAAQNAMSGSYTSITDGCVLVSVLIFWNYALDLMGYRFPSLRWFTEPPPLLLIKNGRLMRQNMGSENITEEELQAQLRHKGIESLDTVKAMYLEPDGHFSVLRRRK